MAVDTCPKCQGRMEEGYTLDQSHGANLQSQWVEGAPRTSFWTGLKVERDRRHEITTYRCANCGYLESYAKSS